jgi:hypothetical protein
MTLSSAMSPRTTIAPTTSFTEGFQELASFSYGSTIRCGTRP